MQVSLIDKLRAAPIFLLCYRGGKLERICTPGGYIADGVRYHYVKDHQGNVRCVVRDDGAVVESNQYYPYGALMASPDNVQPRKYGAQPLARRSGCCNVGCKPVATSKATFGNEWCPLPGLDLYDSSARWYDPVLGRTTTMDPLAEKYPALSPYSWCAANPLRFTDPTGMTISAIIDDDLYYIRKNSDGVYHLYDRNNNLYIPKEDSFGSDLLSDINTIAAFNYGNKLVSYLESSANNVTIKNGDRGFLSDRINGIIAYDKEATDGGLSFFPKSGYGTIRPHYIALAHEFAHIEDFWKGTFDNSSWYSSNGSTTINAEKYALYVENQIRKEHHQPLRLYYEHTTIQLGIQPLYLPTSASRVNLTLPDVLYLFKNRLR